MRYSPTPYCATLLLVACAIGTSTDDSPRSPIDRGFAFLEREVRSWRGANGCYSCHNNGDAARAVYLRLRLQRDDTDPIPDTSSWLARPTAWEHNGGHGPFNDHGLARLQFAAALVALDEAKQLARRAALHEAAAVLAADQSATGSWRENGSGNIGSPITYGAILATALARRVLVYVDASRFRERIDAADRWLRRVPVRNVVEAAGALLGLARAGDESARGRRRACLDLIVTAQDADGGFGPFIHAAPEVFDTALVLVALTAIPERAEFAGVMARAAAFLREVQEPDGGWLETTRPPGQTSYAHRISATAWALQALLLVPAR